MYHIFELFRESLERLSLNDAALTFQPEQSQALGSGFNADFSGTLLMEADINEKLDKIAKDLKPDYKLSMR